MEDIHRRIALLKIKDELVKQLKPCPFCGADLAHEFPGCMVFEQVEHRVPGTLIGDEFAVHCPRCGSYGSSARSVEWAVANWNMRPDGQQGTDSKDGDNDA